MKPQAVKVRCKHGACTFYLIYIIYLQSNLWHPIKWPPSFKHAVFKVCVRGRFPFSKNHRFKFSKFSLVEWNVSDRFPEVTCPSTSRNAGWNFVVFENGGLFEHFRGFRAGCTILDSNDDVILLAAVACFMRRESTRVNGYFQSNYSRVLFGGVRKPFPND